MGGPKAELRRSLRARLAGITPQGWEAASRSVCDRLIAALGLGEDAGRPAIHGSGPRTIMLYHATAREVDVSAVAEVAHGCGVRVCLPRAGWVDQSITPALVTAWGENLTEGRHGIHEPAETAPGVDLAEIDAVVVPGLGFDVGGGRIGRGGGFYDRFLARPHLNAWKVGVGLDEQVVDAVPRDVWDVGLDALITPTGTVVRTAPRWAQV